MTQWESIFVCHGLGLRPQYYKNKYRNINKWNNKDNMIKLLVWWLVLPTQMGLESLERDLDNACERLARLCWGGNTDLNCVPCHSINWGPRLKKQGRETWAVDGLLLFISGLWTGDQLLFPSFCLHDWPTMMECSYKHLFLL